MPDDCKEDRMKSIEVSSSSPTDGLSLLDLPTELTRIISNYVVGPGRCFHVMKGQPNTSEFIIRACAMSDDIDEKTGSGLLTEEGQPSRRTNPEAALEASLLRVSRRTRREVLDVLVANNTIVFSEVSHLHSFCHHFRASARKIRYLGFLYRFTYRPSDWYQEILFEEIARTLASLRSLSLSIYFNIIDLCCWAYVDIDIMTRPICHLLKLRPREFDGKCYYLPGSRAQRIENMFTRLHAQVIPELNAKLTEINEGKYQVVASTPFTRRTPDDELTLVQRSSGTLLALEDENERVNTRPTTKKPRKTWTRK